VGSSPAVVDNYLHTTRQQRAQLSGSKHGNTDAAVARHIGRNQRASVDRDAVVDVTRIIKQSKRAKAPAIDLPQDCESAHRRLGAVPFDAIHIGLTVTGRNWQDAHH